MLPRVFRLRWVRIHLVTSLYVENNMRAPQFFDSNAITTAAEEMHFALTAAHYVISLFTWQKRHDHAAMEPSNGIPHGNLGDSQRISGALVQGLFVHTLPIGRAG